MGLWKSSFVTKKGAEPKFIFYSFGTVQVSQEISGGFRNNITPIDIGFDLQKNWCELCHRGTISKIAQHYIN